MIDKLDYTAFLDSPLPVDLYTWLNSPGRLNGVHVMAGPGAGKSRLLGRVIAYSDFMQGIPQVIFDPTGNTTDNFIDKLNRLGPNFEHHWWTQYRKPLPSSWVRYIEYELEQLAERIIYIDMSGPTPFPLYYQLDDDESLFDMAQRILEVFRRLDPNLESASVEGWNALYKLGTYTGMILAALGLQMTEAEHLIRHPERWSAQFEEALARKPQVQPAVAFFKEFSKAKPEQRARRSESLLTKILAFTADPAMQAMFGQAERGISWPSIITKQQTVLLDFRRIQNAERRRFLLLWTYLDLLTYIKYRNTAGRTAPISVQIDEITQMLGYQTNEQSVMAADIEELVSVIARNYGVQLTIAHQSLTQLDERIQSALMQMGTQVVGVLPSPSDAEIVAKYFFRFNPTWVKKEEPVWMGMASEPYYDPVQVPMRGGWFTQMDHISTRTTPTVIDYKTEEFDIEEQRTLLTQAIQRLPRYQFLMRVALEEGELAGQLRPLNIADIDPGKFPDEACVKAACQLLAERIRSVQVQTHGETASGLLEASEVQKPLQPTSSTATMKIEPTLSLHPSYVAPNDLSSADPSNLAVPVASQADETEQTVHEQVWQ